MRNRTEYSQIRSYSHTAYHVSILRDDVIATEPSCVILKHCQEKCNNGRYSLPFLAMETDGSSLSQMAETKLESFIRSAHRLNRELKVDETFEV